MSALKVLYRSNTLVEVLKSHAETNADKVCITVVEAGQRTTFTYGQLWERAQLAAGKISTFSEPGDRILLAMPTSADFIDYFFGCILSNRIAVPLPVEKSNARFSRVDKVISDCTPTSIIFRSSDDQQAMSGSVGALRSMVVTDLKDILGYKLPEQRSAHQVAFIQYTSGSTSAPKGVVLTHQNLIANIRMIQQGMQITENERVVSWLPLHHDMGLIGNLLTFVCCGATTYLYPYQEFARNPLSWIEALSAEHATLTGAPTFAFDLIGRRFQKESTKNIDLSMMRLLYCGSERISSKVIQTFFETLASAQLSTNTFFPCYGLAEGSLYVSGGFENAGSLRQLAIGPTNYPYCGSPAAGLSIRLVDESGLPNPPGEIGEIQISGQSVSVGYWKEICDQIDDGTFKGQSAEWLPTGDLGCIHDSNIVVTGRLKDLLKLRGRSFFSEDVELAVERIEEWLSANSVVATSKSIDGNSNDPQPEALTIFAEVIRSRRAGPFEAFAEKVQESLGDLELRFERLIILSPGSLPKTSSGKKQRSRTAEMFSAGSLKVLWDSTLHQGQVVTTKLKPMSDSPEIEIIKRNIRSITKVINFDLADERRTFPADFIARLHKGKLLDLLIPRSFGGSGLTNLQFASVGKALGADDLTFASMVGNHNTIGVLPIVHSETYKLRQAVLADIASSGSVAAFALTEPDAGSNPRAITTKAQHVDGKILLQGEKVWIGNAKVADYITIFANEIDKSGKELGVSAFLLRRGHHDFEVGEEQLTLGLKAMPQSRLFIEQCTVTDEDRLTNPGEGMKLAFASMEYARFGLAAMAVGAMDTAMQKALAYADDRKIWTGSLAKNGHVRHVFAEMTLKIASLDHLVTFCAATLDATGSLSQIASLACKIASGEWAFECIDRCLQLVGGRGYTEPFGIARAWRDSRIIRIFEGPTETLAYQLAGILIRDPSQVQKFIQAKSQSPAAKIVSTIEGQLRDNQFSNSDEVDAEASHVMLGIFVAKALSIAVLARNQESSYKENALVDTVELMGRQLNNDIQALKIMKQMPHPARKVVANRKAEVHLYDEWTGILQPPFIAPPVEIISQKIEKNTGSVVTIEHEATELTEQEIEVSIRAWLKQFTRQSVVNVDTSIAAYGVDSLLAYELLCFVEERFGVTLPDTIIGKRPSTADLTKMIFNFLQHGDKR